jgi:phage host-nuclease inhibitor protein Gam
MEHIISNDFEADKALQEIQAKRAEIERLRSIANSEIEEIRSTFEAHEATIGASIQDTLNALELYFSTLPEVHSTKTQDSYKLLHGKLVRKRGGVKYERNNSEALADWLSSSGYSEFTETKLVPKWNEFKKLGLTADPETGVVTVAGTGEVVQGVIAVKTLDTFDVR